MIDKMTVWNNSLAMAAALVPFYQTDATGAIAEAGARDSWFALLQAAGEEPHALTRQRLDEVLPYSSSKRRAMLLEAGLSGGFLNADSEGGYTLTDAGRAALAGFYDNAQEAIGTVPTLDDEQMNSLAETLERIVTATEALPKPDPKPNLARSRWTDPGPDAAAIVRADQYVTDLQFYRDDAHITAWRPYDVDGHVWEAFSFVWSGDAQNAEKLLEARPNRGYDLDDYNEAYETLVQKGWIAADGDGFKLTKRGRGIRDEAEESTDQLFFAGWDVLSATELEELNSNLESLKDILEDAAPVTEPA